MKTCPPTMAADDLTGPSVLNVQSSTGFSARLPDASPVSAGLPRNIRQSAPWASAADNPRYETMFHAMFMHFGIRRAQYRAGAAPVQTIWLGVEISSVFREESGVGAVYHLRRVCNHPTFGQTIRGHKLFSCAHQ